MKIGAFAIIFDENKRVLISLRDDYDLWNLPGGGVEPNESPWAGVIREVKEETGLDAEVVRLSGVYFKEGKDEICFAFICKIVGGEITLSNEAVEHRYVSPEDLPPNFSPKQLERIYDALKDEVALKIQSGPSSIELIKQGKL